MSKKISWINKMIKSLNLSKKRKDEETIWYGSPTILNKDNK
jgi:hypothetical protein